MTQSGHGPLRIAAVDVRKLFVASGLQNSEKIQRAAIAKVTADVQSILSKLPEIQGECDGNGLKRER